MNRRQASYRKHVLEFKKPAGTSRGVLLEKPSFFIEVMDSIRWKIGVGECSILPGLSIDDVPDLEDVITTGIQAFNETGALEIPDAFPALKFAWESAILDVGNGRGGLLFPSDFTEGKKGIPINGLIWMSEPDEMLKQVDEKLASGYTCIKLKIGALDFETELNILKQIKEKYGSDIELRLDANGAFAPGEALAKLTRLSEITIHSIEQPIRQGQWTEMAKLCKDSPIPVALDEELIGVNVSDGGVLLDEIKPQFIILKPSLIGGFKAADEWIGLAEQRNIGWWATSALESNIGLNAIAQWVGAKDITMPQGLGTGGLFTNNTDPKSEIRNGNLYFKAY
jgi:o-succinylbenzoate synthase